jgi:hypothetical protein
MSTTLNHVALSRAQLAQASEFAEAGSTSLARAHLLFAADHALLALETIGEAPRAEVAPVLRDLDDDSIHYMQDPQLTARLSAGFGLVQALIDAYVAHPSRRAPAATPARLPMYGGANGALDARGAEAAERAMRRVGAAIRRTFRRS